LRCRSPEGSSPTARAVKRRAHRAHRSPARRVWRAWKGKPGARSLASRGRALSGEGGRSGSAVQIHLENADDIGEEQARNVASYHAPARYRFINDERSERLATRPDHPHELTFVHEAGTRFVSTDANERPPLRRAP